MASARSRFPFRPSPASSTPRSIDSSGTPTNVIPRELPWSVARQVVPAGRPRPDPHRRLAPARRRSSRWATAPRAPRRAVVRDYQTTGTLVGRLPEPEDARSRRPSTSPPAPRRSARRRAPRTGPPRCCLPLRQRQPPAPSPRSSTSASSSSSTRPPLRKRSARRPRPVPARRGGPLRRLSRLADLGLDAHPRAGVGARARARPASSRARTPGGTAPGGGAVSSSPSRRMERDRRGGWPPPPRRSGACRPTA